MNNTERYKRSKSYKVRSKVGKSILIRPDQLSAAKFIHIPEPSLKPQTIKKDFTTSVLPVNHIQEAIRESRAILDLANDWDDEGAVAILQATWERATSSFLLNSAIQLWKLHAICLEAPDI